MAHSYNKIELDEPLLIDVEALSKHLPEYFYRGPIEKISIMDANTSEAIIDPGNEYRQVLYLDGNKNGKGYTTIASGVPAKELSQILSKIPKDQLELIKSALIGTDLELPVLDQYDIEALQRKDARRIEDNTMFENVRKIGQDSNLASFTSADAQGVLQREVAFTNADSAKPILGTTGAGPCVAIAIYNPETKTASLAHVDADTDLSSLGGMFHQLSKESDATLEVHLAGGLMESRNNVIELIRQIQYQKNIEIKSADIIPESTTTTKSLAIDSRTGEIFTQVNLNQLDPGDDADMRKRILDMKLSMGMKTPLDLIYDGRKPEEQPTVKSNTQLSFTRSANNLSEIQLPSTKDLSGNAVFLTETNEIDSGSADNLTQKAQKVLDALISTGSIQHERPQLWETVTPAQ